MRTKKNRMRNQVEAEINMGAFSDIAFQLIIFFMVCTSFAKPQAQDLQLPSGKAEPEASGRKLPTVSLSVTSMRLNSQPTSREHLEEWLKSQNYPKISSDRPEDTIVIIESEDGVEYGRFFDVVNIIESCGGTVTVMEEQE